jgi:superfamily I DNA/RNA helicase
LTTCVIAASRFVRDEVAKAFAGKGMKTHVIEVSKKDISDPSIIRFSTMHRAKGLEFDQVLVLVPGTYLSAPADTANERKLLYVAITRAKRAAGLVVY